MTTSPQDTRHPAEAGSVAPEHSPEPADTISLARRNLACARVRVLAGLTLGSGIVITLSGFHTSVSSPG
ncbi:hypothetical protein ACWGDX_09220 [Streptomyces sp. NPDC055025]